MEQELIKAIESEMEQIGNTDVQIENIRVFEKDGKNYAFADVSYIWWLNAWDKKVEHKDMIFVLEKNGWKSPLFC